MKDFMFILFGLIGMIAFGQATGIGPASNAEKNGKFEIEYRDSKLQQRFQVTTGEAPSLALRAPKQKEKSQKLNSVEADELSADLTHIYWEAASTAKPEKCTEFATIRLPGEKSTDICMENASATGKLYGLLSKLSKKF